MIYLGDSVREIGKSQSMYVLEVHHDGVRCRWNEGDKNSPKWKEKKFREADLTTDFVVMDDRA